MEPFATIQDVEGRWSPLTSDEEGLVSVRIDDASDIIRTRWPDVDARIASGQLSDTTLRRIVADMVKRSVMNRDLEGVSQASQTAGPFSQSQSFANPNGNLYLSADDVRALNGFGYRPRAKMGWLA